MASDRVTLTIEAPDGADEEVTLPAALLDMLAEGDQTPPAVVADLAVFSCAQRIHATIHHGEEEPSAELQAVEETTMALFEERFEMSFEDAIGHSH